MGALISLSSILTSGGRWRRDTWSWKMRGSHPHGLVVPANGSWVALEDRQRIWALDSLSALDVQTQVANGKALRAALERLRYSGDALGHVAREDLIKSLRSRPWQVQRCHLLLYKHIVKTKRQHLTGF